MRSEHISDEHLWHACTLDDTKAFVQLYHRHWLKLFQTVKFYLKDEVIAEQVLQDVFIVLWRRRKALKIHNFNNYIFITARYHVYKSLKTKQIDPLYYVASYEFTKAPVVQNDAEEKSDLDELHHKLKTALSELPTKCREIFWMSRVENRSNDEIAQELGISKRTVENQISLALKKLRLSYQSLLPDTFLILLWLFWSNR